MKVAEFAHTRAQMSSRTRDHQIAVVTHVTPFALIGRTESHPDGRDRPAPRRLYEVATLQGVGVGS